MSQYAISSTVKQRHAKSLTRCKILKNHLGGANIMERYFNYVISSLSINDMYVLGTLQENDATAGFKAMPNNQIVVNVKLTESIYRRTINRLCANKLIETISVEKQNYFYLSEYGIAALSKSMEGVGA